MQFPRQNRERAITKEVSMVEEPLLLLFWFFEEEEPKMAFQAV